jgi:dipeptide transport system permease protein
MTVSVILGIVLGLLSAFEGGFVDIVLMRTMDLIMSIPDLVLAMVVVAILQPGLVNTIIAVTIVFLPGYVRIVRAAALSELSKDYVTAAKVVGVGKLRLMFVTVLPNCLAPLIVQATLGVSSAILEAAALGFLGMGAQPPSPEWGAMLADSREFLQRAPWVVTLPGLAILSTVVAINLFGDGLRDALDPKLKRG